MRSTFKMRSRRLAALPVLGASIAVLFAFATAVSAQEGPVGDWEGTIAAGGAELPVIFHITAAEDGSLSATLDSPSQGAFGIGVGEITFEDGEISMTIPDVAGGYVGTMSEDGSTIEGTWSQSGMSIELVLTRAEG